MTTYKEIFGKPIKVVSSDPTDAGAEGQVWYNSTSGTFKTVLNAASWSSGGNLGTARYVAGATGNTSAGLYAGGIPAGAPEGSEVEEYNGTSWSEVNNLPETRWAFSIAGTQTSAIAAGGYSAPLSGYTATSREYDGTNWTTGGSMNTARRNFNSCGTQTAALAAGGILPPGPAVSNASEEYNGSSWTSGNPINTARQYGFMIGTIPNAFLAGGSTPGPTTLTNQENYNGTSWTESATDLVTSGGGNNGGGTVTSALVAQGGAQGNTGSQTFNGTAWATSAALATNKGSRAGGGTTQNNSYVAGGGPLPAVSTATEEFSQSIYSPIAATWASGGNVNTARRFTNGAGTQTASLIVNGYGPGFSNATEEYNGSSWSTQNTAPFSVYNSAGGGTQTAAWMTGGDLGPSVNTVTAEYDGTNWSTGGTNPNAKNGGGGCGIQTAGLYAGGQGTTGTQTYNGSAWTSTGHSLNAARSEVSQAMTGIQTAAIIVGSGAPALSVVESYNGSAWASITAIPTVGYAIGSSGTQTSALIYGGGPASFGGTTTALWDGLSWTNSTALGNVRGAGGSGKGSSPSSAAFYAAGHTSGPTNSSAMEVYTGEIPALDYKTLTSS